MQDVSHGRSQSRAAATANTAFGLRAQGTPKKFVTSEAVSLHTERPAGSPRNVWAGTVREITATGSRLRVLIASETTADTVAEVTPQAAAELGLADGTPVWCSVKATEITLVAL